MAIVLEPCKQSQLSHNYWINATETSKTIQNFVIARSAIPRRKFKFHTRRLATLCGNFSHKNLQAAQFLQNKKVFQIQAKSRKGGKANNSGDNFPHFGPLFADGSSGIDSPVPLDQQPVYEYQNLVESVLFSWAVRDVWGYAWKLSAIGAAVTALLGWPVMAWNVNPEEEFLKCGAGALCGGLLAVTLAVLRMYLGWAFVGNRLFSAVVEYEETGWYDGKIWVKPPEVLARDRLLGSYKVKPALNRIKVTLLGLAASLVTCTIFVLSLESTYGDAQVASENTEDYLKQSYGGPYNDASARMFEPEAFANESEQDVPD